MTLTSSVIQAINNIFQNLGGYQFASAYFSDAELVDATLFGGTTIYLTPAFTNGVLSQAVDLQGYGYVPGTYLTTLDDQLRVIDQRILAPTIIQGQAVYCWGSQLDERQLLMTKVGRFFFSFETDSGTVILQVISNPQISPASKTQLLANWRVLQASNIPNNYQIQADELFVTIPQTMPLVSIFVTDSVQPPVNIFSPLNQQTYTAGANCYLTSTTNAQFAFRLLTQTGISTYAGQTTDQVVAALNALNYQRIYSNLVTMTDYWVSPDLSTRLDIQYVGGLVGGVTSNHMTVLTLANLQGQGTSRLRYSNGIYTLRSAIRLDPLQPSNTVRLIATSSLSQ